MHRTTTLGLQTSFSIDRHHPCSIAAGRFIADKPSFIEFGDERSNLKVELNSERRDRERLLAVEIAAEHPRLRDNARLDIKKKVSSSPKNGTCEGEVETHGFRSERFECSRASTRSASNVEGNGIGETLCIRDLRLQSLELSLGSIERRLVVDGIETWSIESYQRMMV